MKISVVTGSIREKGLDVVEKSLLKQDFPTLEWEWVVCSPFKYLNCSTWVPDRGKLPGEKMGCTKAFNDCFKAAKGELIITVCDMESLDPITLSTFWKHYQENKKSVVHIAGEMYNDFEFKDKCWTSPMLENRDKGFYLSDPIEYDGALSAFSKKLIMEIGGFDEKFDTWGALADQEACMRLQHMGCPIYLDTTIKYRSVKHEGHGDDWDEMFKKSTQYYEECKLLVEKGERLKLNYL